MCQSCSECFIGSNSYKTHGAMGITTHSFYRYLLRTTGIKQNLCPVELNETDEETEIQTL